MSTRYVWGRYHFTYDVQIDLDVPYSEAWEPDAEGEIYIVCAPSYSRSANPSTKYLKFIDDSHCYSMSDGSAIELDDEEDDFFYITPAYLTASERVTEGPVYRVTSRTDITYSNGVVSATRTVSKHSVITVLGDLDVYVAGISRTSYKDNVIYGYNASNQRLSKYLGSDCIDPVSVTIPAEILPGDTITAALTARANTYGGTITYTYSYSVDGGSTWTNAGSTTATSLAIAVPEDAEQFMVRAVAKDNYGFTSTTYVKSANVEVQRGAKLLACIDGVIREITPTVMVDGVLRELTEVPAMIDGVNRDLGAG